MAYDNVMKLMNDCKTPAAYNFEHECAYEDYRVLPPFERFLTYKATALGQKMEESIKNGKADERTAEGCYHEAAKFSVESYQKYPDLADCDGWDGKCALAVSLYEQLWGWKEKEEKKYESIFRGSVFPGAKSLGLLGGDTFNSVQTTMNRYVEVLKDEREDYRKHLLEKMSIRFCLQLYRVFGQDFIGQLEKNKGLLGFVQLTHTMGNLVLVPAGYNGWRGRTVSVKDYADLSLFQLLHCCDGRGEAYFGTDAAERERRFARYINFQFLWDYVEKASDNTYRVRPLCASHEEKMRDWDDGNVWNGMKVLPRKEELEGLCGAVNSRIERRGRFMTAMLAVSIKYPDVYEYLMEEVFLTERIYSDYREVTEAVRESVRRCGQHGTEEKINEILRVYA